MHTPMRQHIRLGTRVLSYLDSAPSPSDIAQDVAPATPADAAQAVSPDNVLLFIHAFPLNAAMWTAEMTSVPAGWRYLAPDLPGFGESESADGGKGNDLSLDDYARDLLALLDRLNVGRAVVAGLSMGGYTAFALLRLAPHRVRGVVLANTKAEADNAEARQGRLAMLDLLEREGVAGVVEQMVPKLVGATTRAGRPEIEERVRAIANANSGAGVRGALVRMMNRHDSTAMLSGIRCPSLVVASDEDTATPAEHARAIRQRIPGADFAFIEPAGHLSNLEQPAQFDRALRGFLGTRFGG